MVPGIEAHWRGGDGRMQTHTAQRERERCRPSPRALTAATAGTSQQPASSTDAAVQRALGQIVSALGALCLAPRWRDVVLPALRARVGCDGVDELVCYALGSLEDRGVSYQFALLLLLANALEVPVQRRLVYDPRHCDLDRAVLRVCGLTVLGVDEHAERRVAARTLFFMPFAPYWLTDNVLRANWAQLHQIVVIGNPLRWVSDPEWDRAEDSGALGARENVGTHGYPNHMSYRDQSSGHHLHCPSTGLLKDRAARQARRRVTCMGIDQMNSVAVLLVWTRCFRVVNWRARLCCGKATCARG
jgi:hypothetical protein